VVQVSNSSIRIYRLIDPNAIASQAALLAKLLFGNSGQSRTSVFGTLPASGYLFFSDSSSLWSNTSGTGLPQDGRSAELAARRFLEGAKRRLAGDRQIRANGLNRIIPDGLQLQRTALVSNPDSGSPDHWLCQYRVTLPASAQEQAIPVDGSMMEIRIGSGGSVIGFWLRWRCYSSDESVSRISLPRGYNLAGQVSTMPGIPAASPINPLTMPLEPNVGPNEPSDLFSVVYLLADENAPQTILAPFYKFAQDDSAVFYPASQYSIIVNINQSPSDNGMSLTADVSGGFKNYKYRWADWKPDSLAEEGLIDLGDGETVEIGPGVHNVVLCLEDALSGVVVQVESLFYVAAS
jgi:hypothetical protein